LAAAEALGTPPGECLMVGDTPADVEAGQRAGMQTCAVAWGYGDRGAVQRAEPDYWIETPGELLRLPQVART
jgi:phosphoglycolate phosphatase-like HAD superfamily hydrolase